ncbi:MAG: dihydroorotase [Synergistaceae bacterium]|jgi:dihydroorotase|nr:dihydroorotase [Synergistaceae bacterium]
MILIKDGRLIDPKSGVDEVRDVVLEGERVKYIGKFHVSDEYERVIDARSKVIAPGLVDVHVHFREPGFTYKEDISSGAAAAARGGFTTVVCMANTKPAADNPQVLQQVLESAARVPIRVRTVAAVSKGFEGRELTDMGELKAAGAVGFSDDGVPITDPAFLREAMRAVRELDVPVSLHEEDPSLIGRAGINDGEVAAALGLVGAPKVSESSMVARDCMLALDTGAKVHMQHVSCAESIAVIRLAKELGARVTAEATPSHFSLTEKALLEKGTLAKLNPPLRNERDRYALVAGLKDGAIDMIATDHAPHSDEEKRKKLTEAPSGLTGLETSLALGITNLVRNGRLTLFNLIEKMALSPARLYGFDAGYLAEGAPADVVIFDDKESWVVSNFASKANNSPFVGQTLLGKVKYTICQGKIVYEGE